MKRRTVDRSPEAADDLVAIKSWIERNVSADVAASYVARIVAFCQGLEISSQRGTPRNDVMPGLRGVGFERGVSVAFYVETDRVEILGLYRARKNWTSDTKDHKFDPFHRTERAPGKEPFTTRCFSHHERAATLSRGALCPVKRVKTCGPWYDVRKDASR